MSALLTVLCLRSKPGSTMPKEVRFLVDRFDTLPVYGDGLSETGICFSGVLPESVSTESGFFLMAQEHETSYIPIASRSMSLVSQFSGNISNAEEILENTKHGYGDHFREPVYLLPRVISTAQKRPESNEVKMSYAQTLSSIIAPQVQGFWTSIVAYLSKRPKLIISTKDQSLQYMVLFCQNSLWLVISNEDVYKTLSSHFGHSIFIWPMLHDVMENKVMVIHMSYLVRKVNTWIKDFRKDPNLDPAFPLALALAALNDYLARQSIPHPNA